MARTGPVTKDTSTIALGLAQIRVGSAAANIAQITAQLAAANSIGALANTKFTSAVDYWKLESGFPMLEDLTIPLRESARLECAFKELTPYNLALARGIDVNAAVNAEAIQGDIFSTSGTIAVDDIDVTNDGGVISEEWTVVFTGATAGSIYGKVTGVVHTFVALNSAMAPDNSGDPYFSIPANFFTGTWAATDTFTFTTKPYTAAGTTYAGAHSGSIGLGALGAPQFVRMEAVYTYPNGTNHMYIIFPRANCTTSVEIDMQAEDNANVPLTFEAKRADAEVTGGHSAWNSMPIGIVTFD